MYGVVEQTKRLKSELPRMSRIERIVNRNFVVRVEEKVSWRRKLQEVNRWKGGIGVKVWGNAREVKENKKKNVKMEDDLKDIGDGGDGKNKQDNYK